MHKILVAAGLLVLAAPSAWAQSTVVEPVQGQPGLPWQSPPQAAPPVAAPPQNAPASPTTLYTVKSANIRAGAGKGYAVIGKTHINDALQIAGFVPGHPNDPRLGWYQLTTGGYISASVVSPTPVAVRRPLIVPPPAGQYPVGACEPYSRVVKIGGEPSQITGTACKQPDGTWSIVNYGVPTPVPAPAPVYVAPAPLVYGPPPPVVIVERPYYRHGPYYDRY